jgi:hypothetical protein
MLEAAHILLVGLLRRTWVIACATVLACAALAAHAVAALVETRYLDPITPGAPPSPRVQAPPHRPQPDGRALVERDMFCSTCTRTAEPGPADGFVPAAILIATSLGSEPRATVRVPETEVQGSWGIGDDIPGVGKVTSIGWVTVELVDASGRHGQLSLLAPRADATAHAASPTPSADTPWADRVRKIDDHTVEIDRALVRELVSGTARPGGTRVLPVTDGGKLGGLRLAGVGESSLAAALNLRNADVISEVNGVHIESANTLLDLYGRIDQLNVVELDGTRAGKPLTLTLRLR